MTTIEMRTAKEEGALVLIPEVGEGIVIKERRQNSPIRHCLAPLRREIIFTVEGQMKYVDVKYIKRQGAREYGFPRTIKQRRLM
ncbi:hypothetical protein HN832_02225 [archaeon]|nr:hypothetical protein [archaeon]MBT4373171.1 hypothetical protein [archaeon]MBT4531516.1 hypothetical protein [archaeon]MBT7001306.1 hypothetical protein [archaeon]MBT7282208.1 hypothetical protein [archaeon]